MPRALNISMGIAIYELLVLYILCRFHSLGSAARSKNHPDSRAIFFDEAKYR
jgi:hypothetical protein